MLPSVVVPYTTYAAVAASTVREAIPISHEASSSHKPPNVTHLTIQSTTKPQNTTTITHLPAPQNPLISHAAAASTSQQPPVNEETPAHQEPATYGCYFCEVHFTSARGLKNHLASVHQHFLGMWKCKYDDCNFFTSTTDGLLTHSVANHDDPNGLRCLAPRKEGGGRCQQIFGDYTQFRLHMRSGHTELVQGDFSCQPCSKLFKTLATLKAHRKKFHSSKPKAEAKEQDSRVI